MVDNDNLKDVWQTLKDEGYAPPEYEQFYQDMHNEENLKDVHQTLKDEGYAPPEYEQFYQDMHNEENLKDVHQTLKDEGYAPPEYEQFYQDMGFSREEAPEETAQPVEQPKEQESVAEKPKEKSQPKQPELTEEQKEYWNNVIEENKEQVIGGAKEDLDYIKASVSDFVNTPIRKFEEQQEQLKSPVYKDIPGVSITQYQLNERYNEATQQFGDILGELLEGTSAEILNIGNNARKEELQNQINERENESWWQTFLKGFGRSDKVSTEMSESAKELRAANVAKDDAIKDAMGQLRQSIANLTGITYESLTNGGKSSEIDNLAKALEPQNNTPQKEIRQGEKEQQQSTDAYDVVKANESEIGQKYNTLLNKLSSEWGLDPRQLNELLARQAYSQADFELNMARIQEQTPSGRAEYYFERSFENSFLGNLIQAAITTPEQYSYRSMATQLYGQDLSAWDRAGAAAMTFLWDSALMAGTGMVGSSLGNAALTRAFTAVVGRGVPSNVAMRYLNFLCANSYLARAGRTAFTGSISMGQTLGLYNLTSELGRQTASGNYNWDAAKEAYFDGVGTGSILGAAAAPVGAWAQKLSGGAKVLGHGASFATEGMAFATSSQLQKMVKGEQLDPWLDSFVDSYIQLVFLKGLSTGGMKTAYKAFTDPKALLQAEDLGGYQLSQEQVKQLREYGGNLFKLLTGMTPENYSEYYKRNIDTKAITRNDEVKIQQAGQQAGANAKPTKAQQRAEHTQALRAEMKKFLENENIDWEAKQSVINTLGGYLDPTNKGAADKVEITTDYDNSTRVITVYDVNGRVLSKTECKTDEEYEEAATKAHKQLVDAQLEAAQITNPIAWDETRRTMGNSVTNDEFLDAQAEAAYVAVLREDYAALKANNATREELINAYNNYVEAKLELSDNAQRALDLYFQMVAGDAVTVEMEAAADFGGYNIPIPPYRNNVTYDQIKERQGKELLAQAAKNPVEALQRAKEMVEDENSDYTEQDFNNLIDYINSSRVQQIESDYNKGYDTISDADQNKIYQDAIEAYEDALKEWTDEEITRLEDNPQEELSKILDDALDENSPVTMDDYLKAEQYVKATQRQQGLSDKLNNRVRKSKEGKSAEEILDGWTMSQISQSSPIEALKMADEWLNDSENDFDIYDYQAVQRYVLDKELEKLNKAKEQGLNITDPDGIERANASYAHLRTAIWKNPKRQGDLDSMQDNPSQYLTNCLNSIFDGKEDEKMTAEEYDLISQYLHAQEIYNGACEREIQDTERADREYVRGLELKDDKGEPTGRVVEIVLKDHSQVKVISGDIAIESDGEGGYYFAPERSGDAIIVENEEGIRKMISPQQDVLYVDDIISEDDYLQQNTTVAQVIKAQEDRLSNAMTVELLPEMKEKAEQEYNQVREEIVKRLGDENAAQQFIDAIEQEGGIERIIALAGDEEQPDFDQTDVDLAQRYIQAKADLDRVNDIEEQIIGENTPEPPTAEDNEKPTAEDNEKPTAEDNEKPTAEEEIPTEIKALQDSGLNEETIKALSSNPKQTLADLRDKVSDDVYNLAKEYADAQWVESLNTDSEPDWNSAPSPEAAFDAIVKFAGGNTNLALRETQGMLAEKREEAQKLQKEAEKTGKGKTMLARLQDSRERQEKADKAKEEVALWINIANVPTERQSRKDKEEEAKRKKKAEERKREAEEEAKRIQAEKEAIKGVPDATIPEADTYEAAQNRGFWNVGGKKVDRQGVLNAPQGIETHVAFAKLDDGRGIATGHVALVSADDLQPSHKRGVKNWKLFTDTQPKTARNTPESIGTIRETAQKLDPAKLIGVTNAYQDSMPSVNTRGEVIQGHGRTDAIQQAYEDFPEKAAQYKQYLIDHAKEFGIDPEEVAKMEKPVFVNMMDVSDAEAARWAGFKQGQLESGGYVSLDGKTIAKQMSNKEFSRFISKLMENAGDEDSFAQLLDKNGAKVIMELTRSGLISNAQNRSAIDANGHLVPTASNDIANLLLGRMFGDDVNTATLFQSSSFPKKAQRAILSSIYKDFATKDPDQTIAPEISNAIKAFSELTADESFMSAKDFPTANKLAESFTRQARFDADGNITYPLKDYSNFAVTLAALFKGGTQKEIQATLTDIISLVQGNKQPSLLGENGGDATPEPPKPLREAVKQVLDIDYNENEQQKRVKKNEGQERNSSVDVNNASSAAGEQTNEANPNGGESTQTGAEPTDNTGGTTSVSEQGQQGEVNEQPSPTQEAIQEAEKQADTTPTDVKSTETLDKTPTEAKPLLNENDNIPTAMSKATGKTLVKVTKSDKGDYLTVYTDIGYKGGKAKTVNYTHFGLGEGFQIEKTRENVGTFVAKLKANGYREATPEELKQIEDFVQKHNEQEEEVSAQIKSANRKKNKEKKEEEGKPKEDALFRVDEESENENSYRRAYVGKRYGVDNYIDYTRPDYREVYNDVRTAIKKRYPNLKTQDNSAQTYSEYQTIIFPNGTKMKIRFSDHTKAGTPETLAIQDNGIDWTADNNNHVEINLDIARNKMTADDIMRFIDKVAQSDEKGFPESIVKKAGDRFSYQFPRSGIENPPTNDEITKEFGFDIKPINNSNPRKYSSYRVDENGQNEVTSTPEEISEHIDNLQKRFKNKVTQINSLDEVTDETARKKIEQDQKNGTKKTKGWYDPNTGEVVLYTPHITSIEDAERTIIHETKGHKGLRALLGDNFNKSMDKIYNLLPKEVREKIKVNADEKYDGDLIKATEEHLSETAEQDETPTWWEKVCATVKDYIRKAGFDLEMTDADVKYLLYKAEKKLAEGDALDKAEDIAMRNKAERENIRLRSENPFANASTKELDNAYFDAYDKGDRARMREIIDEVARRRGYSNVEDWRYYHTAPMGGEGTKDDEGTLYTWTLKDEADNNPHRANHISDSYYSSVDINGSRGESMSAIQSVLDKIKQGKDPTVTIYRAVPKSVKESKMRNGDWVTFSKAYAENHGEHVIGIGDYRIIKEKVPASQVYWDGNDINEWGFDDGKDYKYKNTENNRKLNNTITFDDEGNIIPPSKRFDSTKESVRFREDDNENNGNIIVNENGGDVILPEDSDIDFGDNYDSAEEAVKNSTKISPTKSARETRQFLVNEAQRNVDALKGTLSAIIEEGNDSKQILRLQRDYDRETLKSFVDEAKEMLADGTLDNATKKDLKDVIGAIEKSIGANAREERFAGKTLKVSNAPDANLKRAAKTIARVMQTNQFRKAKNILDNILGMKGTKVGDDRIVRQKDLDADGQKLMETIRNNCNADLNTLDQKIAETEYDIDNPDEGKAKDAEIRYKALVYARQYRDMVTEQIQTTQEVQEALKAAKKEKASKSYIKALEDELFDIKQNTIDKINSLSCSLIRELGASAGRAKEFTKQQKALVDQIHHYARSDMEQKVYREHRGKPTPQEKVVNNRLFQFVCQSLSTFDQILKSFGAKAVDGKGYLWNHFMNRTIESSNNEGAGIEKANKELDAKVSDVFGGEVKKWVDLYSQTRQKLPFKLSFKDGKEEEEHDITIGNGLYIYMANKMIDGKVKLRGMGIEEEDVERIKEAIDPKLIALADWVQSDFLVNLRNKYNDVHERMFGASMDAIDNYIPLRINSDSRVEKVDINDVNNGVRLPSTTTGAIMKRTHNGYALDILNTDGIDIVEQHITEMEHWANYAECAHEINILLSDKVFKNQVKGLKTVYGSGDTLWRNFAQVAAMAGGNLDLAPTVDTKAVKVVKNVTRAQIALRLNTAAKQLLSAPAFIPHVRLDYATKAVADPVGSWNWAMENLPSFRKRWVSRQMGETRLDSALDNLQFYKNKWIDKFARWGMTPNVAVDGMTIALGAKATYDTSYNRYINERYPEDKAREKALFDATVAFNESQQSTEKMFVSNLQVAPTFMAATLTAFRNASMSYTRQVVDAGRNLGRRFTQKGYKEKSVGFMQKQILRDVGLELDTATKDQKDWAQYVAERRYKRQGMKDALTLFTYGYIIPSLWNMGAHMPYYLLGNDDDKKKELLKRDLLKGVWGSVEGLVTGNIASDMVCNLVNGDKLNDFTYYSLPAISEFGNILSYLQSDIGRAANDFANLCVMGVMGINPQVVEDTGLAIYDICNQDEITMQEVSLLIAQIMQMPQSQIDELRFDEIDMTGKDAKKLTPEQIAQRYVDIKYKRTHFLTQGFMSEEAKKNKKDALAKQAKTKIRKREGLIRLSDEEANNKYNDYQKRAKEIKERLKSSGEESLSEEDSNIYEIVKAYNPDITQAINDCLNAKSKEELEEAYNELMELKQMMIDDIEREDDESEDDNASNK